MRLSYLMVICFVATSTSACMPRQSIKYPTDDITTSPNSSFSNAVLAVKPFADIRKPLRSDCPSMEVSKIEKDEKTYYYNCDNHYKSDSVTKEISKAVTDHINHTHLFEQAILSDVSPPNADYLLTGQVSKFDGLKEHKLGAVVASSFGLFGALINLAMDSNYEATTTLDGLQLIRLKDNSVIWSGNVTGHVEGEDTVDAYGWSAYWKANLSLKAATANLVKNLANLKVNAIQTQNIQPSSEKRVEALQPVAQSPR